MIKKLLAIIAASITLTATPAWAGTMYATTGVNVRALPSIDAEIITTLTTGEAVEVVAMIERGRPWAIVEHDGALRAVCADYLSAEEPAPPASYYGTCRITFYCPCAQCCGPWAGGSTASGTTPTAGRTVANGALPFGTHVLIDGQEYVVEDRGVSGDQFDIFVNSHQEALNRGLYYSEVYIVE